MVCTPDSPHFGLPVGRASQYTGTMLAACLFLPVVPSIRVNGERISISTDARALAAYTGPACRKDIRHDV